MNPKQLKLARRQLDQTLKRFQVLQSIPVPKKGWIRAIRDTLGMTGSRLAHRLGVKQQRITRIEQDERLGKVTLRTMQQTAEAMDCIFVYAIVPRDSLEAIVRKQAQMLAQKRMAQSSHTMHLEQQELTEEEQSRALEDLIDEIIDTMPKTLWDK